ncbi:hypothetical protein [Arenimonas composti]|uniref:Uncharacterized protein n=1 Tax=Arenimonas composti TR7-09 = DSM 18010 TaxID=1121013 RepID=A0A091BE60_9GAMM|nr:hypothetical protein [Arenimonas composti]KFN49109.1 hypothetical protein P873_12515 [Arenimonas composti TR7-09 = DSM 18010]
MKPHAPSRPWVIAVACLGCVLVTTGVFLHHIDAQRGGGEPGWYVLPAASLMCGFLAFLAIRGSGLTTTAPAVLGAILMTAFTGAVLVAGLSSAFD